jgi:hypothetical protein
MIGWWERDIRNPRRAFNVHQILFDLPAKCLSLLLLPSPTPPSAMILLRRSQERPWTMMSSFPTTTHHYVRPYPTGDQIQERGKNISTVTDGETFSDLWMDDLIYATTIHASHHLQANGNLDGYVVIVDVLVF